MILTLSAWGGPDDNGLGLHSDGGGWGFTRATKADPKLPRVLLVGDSVMNGYRGEVVRLLAGKANVDTWATGLYLSHEHLMPDLAKVLRHGPYSVIHFNIGLHDWPEGRIPSGNYEPLIRRYFGAYITNAPGAKLIWASSTPVTAKGAKTLDPIINPVIQRQNEIAAGVARSLHIPINDLYSLGAQHLAFARGDQFHWSPDGSRLLGSQVARQIALLIPSPDVPGIHVPTNGQGTNPGSVLRPFGTPKAALKAAPGNPGNAITDPNWVALAPTAGVCPVPPAYEAWRHAHFTPAELASPLISGESADPDSEAVTNRAEYVTAIDPRSAASFPVLSINLGAFDELLVSFASSSPRRYTLEVASPDLDGPWMPVLSDQAGPGGVIESVLPPAGWSVLLSPRHEPAMSCHFHTGSIFPMKCSVSHGFVPGSRLVYPLVFALLSPHHRYTIQSC